MATNSKYEFICMTQFMVNIIIDPFHCNICDLDFSFKSKYERHLESAKHRQNASQLQCSSRPRSPHDTPEIDSQLQQTVHLQELELHEDMSLEEESHLATITCHRGQY